MEFHEAAIIILKEKGRPLNLKELWSEIEHRNLVETYGKTPWLTLSTSLRRKTEGIQHKRQDSQKIFYLENDRFGLLEWRKVVNYLPDQSTKLQENNSYSSQEKIHRDLTANKSLKSISSGYIETQNNDYFQEIIAEIDILSKDADSRGDFTFEDIVDAREKTLRSIALRRGQPHFREQLLNAYNHKCAISSCTVDAVLEAAHIIPYFGEKSNNICNGILLRADIHLLFDRLLIFINPDNFRIIIHPMLCKTYYQHFDNIKISLPVKRELWPSQDILKKRLVLMNKT